MKKLSSILLLALLPIVASAQLTITTGQLITGFTGGDSLNVGPGTAGYSFTVGAAPLLVQGLGLFDASGTGLAASHAIGIWDTTTATPTLVSSVTVTPTGATDINNFWYMPVTPFTLISGRTYVAAAQYADIDFDQVKGNATGLAMTGATYGHALLSSGIGFGFPDIDVRGADQGFFGPNLSFAPVPEPTWAGAITAGVLAAWAAVRRWKARQAPTVAAA